MSSPQLTRFDRTSHVKVKRIDAAIRYNQRGVRHIRQGARHGSIGSWAVGYEPSLWGNVGNQEKLQRMDYPAEIFDQVQLLFDVTGFHDHQLHCVLRFESGPDAALLNHAVMSSIAAFPILSCRYSAGQRPCWRSLASDRFGAVFVAVRTEAEFEAVIVSRVDLLPPPSVAYVCLV